MSGRENILRRVRTALATPAPKVFGHEAETGRRAGVPMFPDVGSDFDSLRRRFAEELTLLKGEFVEAADGREANAKLRELLAQSKFKEVVAQDTAEMRCWLHEITVTWVGEDVGGGAALGKFDLGVTHCDTLVARTGSVVLTAKSAGGRALSVLPHNHLVIARRDQLVADLRDAMSLLQRKYRERMPSFVSVVSGPSRTSDIEKMLVLGAHGPKRLMVMVVAS
jgi:L-lactate dehydrogenase complex protein LldG